MIRYISWAIPSIGFIGTVRGIGEALAQADKAVQGDIAGAMKMNSVAVLLMPLLAFMIAREIAAWAWKKPEWRPGIGGRWGIILGVAVVLYGILRNLPGFEFLRPGGP